MGFDGNGNWSSPFFPVTDRDNGVAILASKFQTLIQSNLKESFENCLLRDGTGRPTSNINWNGQKITNLASGTSSADAVNKYQLDQCADLDLSNITAEAKAIIAAIAPVGSLRFGPVNSMDGFLLCNGAAYSRTEYADLYAVISTNFGAGDGSTTFNVPDYRGCFLRGLGGNSAADMFTKQPTALPNIKGTFAGQRSVASSGALSTVSSPYLGSAENWVTRDWDCSINLNAANYSSIYQDDITEARPVNFAVNFFIKY